MIRLAWPSSDLSPNARKDRRAATNARKLARLEGWAAVKSGGIVVPADAHLDVTFCPPNAIRRDLDNAFASIKAHLDGIAAASKVDDTSWGFTLTWGPVVKGGAVIIRVTDKDGWRSIGEIAATMVKGSVT